ncbi:hypothetical protein Misp05_59680 [Micromonospora sp. NBRC 107095]|nr:hypothetical protein Misp05_59680 [Micromonospora sp. NBRC 107095]
MVGGSHAVLWLAERVRGRRALALCTRPVVSRGHREHAGAIEPSEKISPPPPDWLRIRIIQRRKNCVAPGVATVVSRLMPPRSAALSAAQPDGIQELRA